LPGARRILRLRPQCRATHQPQRAPRGKHRRPKPNWTRESQRVEVYLNKTNLLRARKPAKK
jgi:hypothetical protein